MTNIWKHTVFYTLNSIKSHDSVRIHLNALFLDFFLNVRLRTFKNRTFKWKRTVTIPSLSSCQKCNNCTKNKM